MYYIYTGLDKVKQEGEFKTETKALARAKRLKADLVMVRDMKRGEIIFVGFPQGNASEVIKKALAKDENFLLTDFPES